MPCVFQLLVLLNHTQLAFGVGFPKASWVLVVLLSRGDFGRFLAHCAVCSSALGIYFIFLYEGFLSHRGTPNQNPFRTMGFSMRIFHRNKPSIFGIYGSFQMAFSIEINHIQRVFGGHGYFDPRGSCLVPGGEQRQCSHCRWAAAGAKKIFCMDKHEGNEQFANWTSPSSSLVNQLFLWAIFNSFFKLPEGNHCWRGSMNIFMSLFTLW